jgi:type IV pilus assembly protein PilB
VEGADEAVVRFLAKHSQIDAATIAAAEEYARSHRVTMIEALCDGGFVEEEMLAELFHTALRLPRTAVRGALVKLERPVDDETLQQHLAAPAEVVSGRLVVAMANPLDHEALRKISFACGLRTVPAVATLREIRTVLTRPIAPQPQAVDDDGTPDARAPERLPSLARLQRGESASHSPIVKMAAMIIEQALALRASDIHLEPTVAGLTVRYRIDGTLEEATRLAPAVRNPLIARLKVMASLDIAERRVPQDGGLSITVGGRQIDCRVSTLPTQYGEKVVIRILDAKAALVRLDQLGFESGERARVDECLHQSEGLILTTGPTGSGKTTTLYAMLQAIHSPEVNIVTVENPIEYRLPGINQTEVNERQGMTFAAALRSILRQDPDVILVGEIRDRETAEIAVQAAQTGHLVLSTLHTNDSVSAVTRLAKLDVDRELIASTLRLVIAQRLVRAICPRCTEPVPADSWSGLPWRGALRGATLHRGRGCPECRDTGYQGRVGLFEIFRNTLEAKQLIADGAGETELREAMRRQGGRTLTHVAIEKLRNGRTTPDEVVQVIKPDDSDRNCPSCGVLVDARAVACAACGTVLRRVCGACQTPLPVDAEQCHACGAAPGSEPPPAVTPPSRTVIELIVAKGAVSGSIVGAGVRSLCAASGLDDLAAGELELAVVEACGLACMASTDGELRISLELSPDGHSVCLSDEGPAWSWPRPSARPPGLEAFSAESTPEVRAFLVRSSVDEASYEREQRVNRLWLIKRPALPFDPARTCDGATAAALHH